jgi:HEAT repeat protein
MSLRLLWMLIIALAAFGVVMLLGLLVARVLRDRLVERRNRQRAEIARALLLTVQNKDARGLGRYGHKDLLVAEAAQDIADIIRGPELARMKAVLAAHGLGERLIRRMSHGRKRQRMVAAETLALLPGEATVAALNAARDDPVCEIRLAALFSLMELGEAPTIAQVLETMGSGVWSQSLLVTELLRRLAPDHEAELAAQLSRTDQPSTVQVMLLEAVGGAGEFEMLSSVVAQARDSDPAVRAAAVRAMGRLAHPMVSPNIDRALEDSDPGVRRDAVIAAHSAALHELAPALGRRLNDRIWDVRHAAAQALADLGEPGRAALRGVFAQASKGRRREIKLALKGPRPW